MSSVNSEITFSLVAIIRLTLSNFFPCGSMSLISKNAWNKIFELKRLVSMKVFWCDNINFCWKKFSKAGAGAQEAGRKKESKHRHPQHKLKRYSQHKLTRYSQHKLTRYSQHKLTRYYQHKLTRYSQLPAQAYKILPAQLTRHHEYFYSDWIDIKLLHFVTFFISFQSWHRDTLVLLK